MKLRWLVILIALTGCSIARHTGPPTDHFNGKVFFNPGIENDKSFFDVLKWKLTSKVTPWPDWIEIEKSSWKPKLQGSKDIQITWVNHASVLIEWGELNILTDPLFSKRTSPVSWMGPSRKKRPGLEVDELPKIDVILISHNHYDHLDLPSLKSLNEKFRPKIFAPLGDCKIIESIADKKNPVNCQEMDWGDLKTVGGLDIHFLPCQHWSARSPFDRNHSLWGAFLISDQKKKIYFGGDTGYGPHFKKVFDEYGPVDLSLLPIGAYEPRWFMKTQHMNPEEAVQAHLDLKAKKSLGIHFGTFQLTDEGVDEPKKAIKEALIKMQVPEDDFMALENGSAFSF